MALCEQCGSIQIVRAKRKPTDRLVAFFTSKRPFVCRRCGWRACRDWTDLDLDNLRDYGAGGAEPDPSLTVLDGDRDADSATQRREKRRRKRNAEPKAASQSESFDLAALDLVDASVTPPATKDGQEELSAHAPIRERRIVRKRRIRSQRREVVAMIAVTSMVMFVVALSMTGSCSGSGF